MLPLVGFACLSVFGGYSIYFPELFPTRLAGHGGRILLQHGALSRGCRFPLMLMSLNSLLVDQGVSDPFRTAAMWLSRSTCSGIVALIWAPETKGKPLPED